MTTELTTPERLTFENRSDWTAERSNGLGASEASAAIGVNPFLSPMALWALKSGLLPADELAVETERMRWGTLLEGTIIAEFAARTGREVVPHNQCEMLVHPELSFLRATPDGLEFDRPRRDDAGDLQIKTVGAFVAAEWERGETPLHVQVQVQTELAVTGLRWGSVACLIGGQRLVWRDVERDDSFIDALLPALEKFWRCVETRTPPAIDGSEITSRVLARLHPDDNGETIDLPDEAAQWRAELSAVKEKLTALENLKTLNENRLKAAIGDATFGRLSDGSLYSLKTQERAAHEVNASRFRVLRSVAAPKSKGKR